MNGRSVDQIARVGIARTYQNIRLFNNMTVIENIMVGQEAHLRSTWIGAILGTAGTRRENRASVEEGLRLLHFVGCRAKATRLRRIWLMATSGVLRLRARWPAVRSCCCWMNLLRA